MKNKNGLTCSSKCSTPDLGTYYCCSSKSITDASGINGNMCN